MRQQPIAIEALVAASGEVFKKDVRHPASWEHPDNKRQTPHGKADTTTDAHPEQDDRKVGRCRANAILRGKHRALGILDGDSDSRRNRANVRLPCAKGYGKRQPDHRNTDDHVKGS